MISIPDSLLGREVDLGQVTVTAQMVAEYMAAVADPGCGAPSVREAPPTFCLALRRGMTPEIELPPDLFGVYGGHDLEFRHPIRVGERYRITACVADVYEKFGRSGVLTVVVREATIRDDAGTIVACITEHQIIRQRQQGRPSGEP